VIPGIEQAKSVAMKETAPGTYTGSLAIPAGLTVKEALLLASIKKSGQSSPTLQATQRIVVDTVGPTVANLSPAPDASLPPGKPLIYGTLSDAGTGINPQGTTILMNGKDVTANATVTEAFISYKPEADLVPGKETVTIVARDNAGNETRKQWLFTVAAQESLIKSVRFTPDTKTLEPGDVLTVTLTGKPGGNARFSIGGTVTGQTMQEGPAGTYVGTYTVKKGDSLAKAPVSAALTVNGRTVTQSAEGSLTIAAGAPDKPTITSPVANASVGDTFTLAGKAKAGATVRYTVRYTGTLIVLPVSGAIADGEVKANDKGEWSVAGLKLSVPTGVTKVAYQVAAVTVGAAGEQSEPVTVNVKR
jgi:plastocyanin